MLRSAARKKDWTLTKEAFERLLDSLDANRERAGEKYENVRRKLIECFEVCLSNLPAASRVLIIEYYREEKGIKIEQRKRQADALNMSLNALRLRVCRIRVDLGDCITSCLDRSREDTKSVIRH